MIGRRVLLKGIALMSGDGLVAPMNAPGGGQPVPGVQPGTSQAVVTANKVIISGPKAGEFVYSGKPALGNLIASDTGYTGVDPFGNNVYSGRCEYLANGTATATLVTRMIDGQFLAGSAAAMAAWPAGPPLPGTIQGVAPASGQLILNSGINTALDTGMLLNLQSAVNSGNGTPQATLQGILNFLNAATPTSAGTYLWASSGSPGALISSGVLVAVQPGTVATPEVRTHSLGTLAGYTVNLGRFWLNAFGDTVIDFSVLAGGANAAAVTFSVTLPAGYRLGNGQSSMAYPIGTNRNQAAGEPFPRLIVSNAGAVIISQTANSNNLLTGTVTIPTS